MTAQQNRARFPEWSKVVDEFRRVFGDDVRVKWVREGDKVLGPAPARKDNQE